jgi:hypothetical protein
MKARFSQQSPGRRPAALAMSRGGTMQIEVVVPDDWTPGLTLAMQQLLQRAFRSGYPIITVIRPDATAEQIQDVYQRIGTVVRESGLTA